MDVRYKIIEDERVEDAPFVGALISGAYCHFNCRECFNQHLKNLPTCMTTSENLVHRVKKNPFNEGIILAGLEWSEQPEELIDIVKVAMAEQLKVMIYTGASLDLFLKRVPLLKSIQGDIWIKHGAYLPEKAVRNHEVYGVKLASSNQKIEHVYIENEALIQEA